MSTPKKSENNDKKKEEGKPGVGWSNGDVAPQMFPVTQDGRLQLYGSNRRWIGLQHGWTRIGGEGATEMDARHSTSQGTGPSLVQTPEHEARTVRALIAQLCETFYKNGWATGTGGGVSIRVPKEDKNGWRVFVAPSGIQKEDMIGDDIFELDMDRTVIVPPKTPNLRQSACTPLWYVVYKERPSAACVIHTHSIHAQMATLLDSTEQAKSLKITHLEMLKGVGNHAYDDVLEVPIIDNRPSEDQLADQLREAVRAFPKCNAVLVRRHGLYAWGDSWEQAKTQCESFDYLFQSAIQMKSMGIDPCRIPNVGTYRIQDDEEADNNINNKESTKRAVEADAKENGHQDNKKVKTTTMALETTAVSGFHGLADVDNAEDLLSNPAPLLPRDAKILLLDIEGCTTSISFVHQTLFPYARHHLKEYLANHMTDAQKVEVRIALAKEVQEHKNNNNSNGDADTTMTDGDDDTNIASLVHYLMDRDVKSSALKDLQGKIWKAGYDSGALKSHVYEDVPLMLQWMHEHNVKVYIYSSGSIAAQKLLFGFTATQAGNLLPFLSGHFDIPTAGPKKEASSYTKIASTLGVDIKQIVFCSDLTDELTAAKQAGMKYTINTIRPGNAPLIGSAKTLFPTIHSLLQLCGK